VNDAPVEFIDDGKTAVIHIDKGILVMSRNACMKALKRGKGYKRATAMQRRIKGT
jgi:hypothetical protein